MGELEVTEMLRDGLLLGLSIQSLLLPASTFLHWRDLCLEKLQDCTFFCFCNRSAQRVMLSLLVHLGPRLFAESGAGQRPGRLRVTGWRLGGGRKLPANTRAG